MLNFVYLVGDRETGEAVAVDPAYAPGEVLDLLAADGMRLTGVLATHYHPDHVGGDMMGFSIVGIGKLLELADVPVHVHRDEARFVSAVTGVTDALVGHDSGDTVTVGSVPIELVHTPGHTPGSPGVRTRISSRILNPVGCSASGSRADRRTRKKPLIGSLTPRSRRGKARRAKAAKLREITSRVAPRPSRPAPLTLRVAQTMSAPADSPAANRSATTSGGCWRSASMTPSHAPRARRNPSMTAPD